MSDITDKSPFDLNDDAMYNAFRKKKLDAYPIGTNDITVEIKDPHNINKEEKHALLNRIKTYNFAIYKTKEQKDTTNSISKHFNLEKIDLTTRNTGGITSIATEKGEKYIPYTDRSVNWHTDGYYNKEAVRSVILHCENHSPVGGENKFFDHEIAYILLRDKSKDYIRVLMEKDIMTIPAHLHEDNSVLREAISSSVFSVIDDDLHMRFTKRKINIRWKETKLLKEALAYLHRVLDESKYVVSKKLKAGEGLLCNNVLHKREGFVDDERQKRSVKRIRFFSYIK